MHETFRQPNEGKLRERIGDFRNIFAVTYGGGRLVSLEAGINPIAAVSVGEQVRCPAILIRSSPWKAGSASTPWHDVFDLDHGYVRYFGDHKAVTSKPLGETRGNAALYRELQLHQSASIFDRARATPLVIFRAVTVAGVQKGHLEFCGLGVIEQAQLIVQWDEREKRSYPNYVFDVALLDLAAEDETLDWAWINARRDSTRTDSEVLRMAPLSWQTWVREGNTALRRIRRQVARNRIMTQAEQLPAPSSPEGQVLDAVYRAFDGRKATFESLASAVAGRVIGAGTGRYHEGWLTQPSSDRGIDFVGRLDAGSEDASTHLVVLGQAKCIKPTSSVSAEQLSRVVARLKRGWIGAYVTTGTYSKGAQLEMIEDDYPVVLVHGLRLAKEVRLMAYENYGGDVSVLLRSAVEQHPQLVAHRRPEEVLLI
ncbi:MAG: restriction endonuclease [Actinobacteria bacterium]|nr:restriction endonuclease [Actinomycetota bacterium]